MIVYCLVCVLFGGLIVCPLRLEFFVIWVFVLIGLGCLFVTCFCLLLTCLSYFVIPLFCGL